MKQSVLQKLKSKFRQSSTISSTNCEEDQRVKEIEINNLWLRENLSREEAENILLKKEIGFFLVRKSETVQQNFVLSVRVPKFINMNLVAHYLIVKSKSGYCLRGFESKEFSDLKSLVTHCSYLRDMLPIQINLEYYNEREKKRNEFIYYFNTKSTSSLSSVVSVQSDFSDLSDLDFQSVSAQSNIFDDSF